ncbi:hypothetical protein P7C73_g4836, partial [Tremellales sp. Uapishka_1]
MSTFLILAITSLAVVSPGLFRESILQRHTQVAAYLLLRFIPIPIPLPGSVNLTEEQEKMKAAVEEKLSEAKKDMSIAEEKMRVRKDRADERIRVLDEHVREVLEAYFKKEDGGEEEGQQKDRDGEEYVKEEEVKKESSVFG